MDLSSQQQKLNDKQNKNQLQYILQNRVGYGKAQKKLSLSLNILLFTDGCESVVIGLLLNQLEKQWNITAFQKSFLITVVYIGVSLGAYIQSYSDSYGRSLFIKWNSILQTVFGLLSCVATSMEYFILLRFVYGIGIGIVIPLSVTYMSQITPTEQRSEILTKSRVYWASGCLFLFVLAWVLLYNHHWRILLFLICLPGVYAIYEHLKYGRQSLRYLWVNKRYDQAFDLLNYMAVLNDKKPLNRSQLKFLQQKTQFSIQQPKNQQVQFKQLFTQKYFKMTLYLLISWFSVCFIYYGIFLLLPTIISRNQKSSYNFKYVYLITVTLVQILCFQLSKMLMDNPMLGRKKTIYLGFFVIAVCSGVLLIIGEENVLALMALFLLIKMFITITIMTLFPYSAQIYPTLLRGKAMGIFNFLGRISIAILGFVGVSALEWFNGKGLYLLFMSFGWFSFFFIYNMPFCTLGRKLDH